MKKEDCIFCKLANGVIPTNAIYEDEDFTVILDAAPASKGHALILPKEHSDDVTVLDEKIAGKAFILGKNIGMAMKKALHSTGFNLVQNNGASAGQTVFHFHLHVIPSYDEQVAPIKFVQTVEVSDEEKSALVDVLKNEIKNQ